MQTTRLGPLLQFVRRNPGRLKVLLQKVGRRLFDVDNTLEGDELVLWHERRAVPMEGWALQRDAALWREAESFAEALLQQERGIYALNPDLGGSGGYPLLYFLTRWKRPQVVVETGVAVGYSSQAILAAMEANGFGTLYSSDFPYFRMESPESFIGMAVEERLKSRWHLRLEGDAENLPRILEEAGPVDLFHYDSDKSYAGRRWAHARVVSHMSPKGMMIFDDIQDNSHFHDLVAGRPEGSFHIFRFQNKYVGLVE